MIPGVANAGITGIEVAKANNGQSNIAINCMGVAKRLNLNAMPVSEEVGNKNFAKNVPNVLFNEGNTKASAQFVWWDGTKFQYTTPPLSPTEIEGQHKKKEIIAEEEAKLKAKAV